MRNEILCTLLTFIVKQFYVASLLAIELYIKILLQQIALITFEIEKVPTGEKHQCWNIFKRPITFMGRAPTGVRGAEGTKPLYSYLLVQDPGFINPFPGVQAMTGPSTFA